MFTSRKHDIILKLKPCAFQWYIWLHSRVMHQRAQLPWKCGTKMQLVHFWTHVILALGKPQVVTMVQLTAEQRIFVVKKWYETTSIFRLHGIPLEKHSQTESHQQRQQSGPMWESMKHTETASTATKKVQESQGQRDLTQENIATLRQQWLTTHRRQVQDGMVLDWATPLLIGSLIWTFISICSTSVMNDLLPDLARRNTFCEWLLERCERDPSKLLVSYLLLTTLLLLAEPCVQPEVYTLSEDQNNRSSKVNQLHFCTTTSRQWCSLMRDPWM